MNEERGVVYLHKQRVKTENFKMVFGIFKQPSMIDFSDAKIQGSFQPQTC